MFRRRARRGASVLTRELMEPDKFVALFVVTLGFSAILGVLSSSYRLWVRRWSILPWALGIHAIAVVGAFWLVGGTVATAIVIAIVIGVGESIGVFLVGPSVERRLHERQDADP